MLKNRFYSFYSVLLIACLTWVISANKFFLNEKAVQKTEQKDNKGQQNIVKIAPLSDATFQLSSFNLDAALHFVFETAFLLQSERVDHIELAPRFLTSYWSKLFASNIIINAP